MSIWPPPFPWLTITDRCRPWVYRSPHRPESANQGGWYVQKLLKKYILKETCSTMNSARRLRYKKRNFFGIKPWMEGSKTIF
jgi:hypothetical protein